MQTYKIECFGLTFLGVKTGSDIDIPIKPVCDELGIVDRGQRERIQRNPVLAEGRSVMLLPSSSGLQEMFCISLDVFHLWLCTIEASRLKNDEASKQLILLQKQGAFALRDYFVHGIAVNPNLTVTLLQSDLFGDEGAPRPMIPANNAEADLPASKGDLAELQAFLGTKFDGLREGYRRIVAAFVMLQSGQITPAQFERVASDVTTILGISTGVEEMVARLKRPILVEPRNPFGGPPNKNWTPPPHHH